ncbi:sigma 54-interacting transcriptional regulator [Myxococcota bacterium]|nr:sigma 54-interacting transcriptional regulator [Myxococcota bacterium]MBU1382044.1 sigma 54-interacting transcriptional regulator [Myxococcota bacterium]MBU1495314.1 sigma 54-interacting transcriptional regulator [Myxococcota bacterium]
MNTASITMDFSLHRSEKQKNKKMYLWDALRDQFIPLSGSSCSIGASDACDIQLDYPGISGRHCRISHYFNGFQIEDTGSKYGIYFNNKKQQQFNLNEGDVFFLANIPFAITGKPEDSSADFIISRNINIKQIQETIIRICDQEIPVLIHGESGTGKELFSEYIHRVSKRHAGLMVSLNCAAIPPQLVESELFGHVKGSFSGAAGSRDGVIMKADKGTLFLDEIGELRADHQATLLRWIENRTFRPVGSDKEKASNCNIVSATHRDLSKDVDSGRFRQDLYYRLSAGIIKIPPLRKRPEDIPLLIKHFNAPPLTDRILKNLLSWHWPGNVRELRSLCIIARYSGWEEAINTKLLKDHSKIVVPQDDDNWTQIQITVLQSALLKHGGNIAKTAKMLGLPRTTLIGKLKKVGLY